MASKFKFKFKFKQLLRLFRLLLIPKMSLFRLSLSKNTTYTAVYSELAQYDEDLNIATRSLCGKSPHFNLSETNHFLQWAGGSGEEKDFCTCAHMSLIIGCLRHETPLSLDDGTHMRPSVR